MRIDVVDDVAEHPLRGRRLVIDVDRVDVGAVREQVIGDLDRRREVQRRLAVAAPRMDHGRIGGDERVETIDQAEPRGGVRGHLRAALDQGAGDRRRRLVEDAEAARPPVRADVDVGARAQEQIHDLEMAAPGGREHRGAAERAVRQGAIERRRFQIGMIGEHGAGRRRIAGVNRRVQRVERVRHR